MGKTYKTGKSSVVIQEDMEEMFLGFLDLVIPNAKKIMDEELQRIQKEAEKNWPKRQPIIRYDRDGNIAFFRKTSKESFKMFKRGIRISGQGEIIVFLKNTARYSWAIKFGEDSKNQQGREIILPQGKRAADELMVKPIKKTSKNVVKALAADLMKRI